MLDIKTWLKEGTGLPVANTAFINKVSLPFIVFLEDRDTERGSDLKNDLADVGITIEFYSAKISKDYEEKIENLLNEKEFKFKKNRTWIDETKCFETIYDFSFLERNDIDGSI